MGWTMSWSAFDNVLDKKQMDWKNGLWHVPKNMGEHNIYP